MYCIASAYGLNDVIKDDYYYYKKYYFVHYYFVQDDFKEIMCREQGGEDSQNITPNCAWMKNVTQEEKQNTFR